MGTRTIARGLLGVLVLAGLTAEGFEETFVLKEHMGYAWPADLVHRTVEVAEAGALLADHAVLFEGETRVPAQIDVLESHPDGSVRRADVWWRTDLPAHAERTFVLRPGEPVRLEGGGLVVKRTGHVIEMCNSNTTVRLPAGEWTAPEGDEQAAAKALSQHLGVEPVDGLPPGPLLGVRLPSGTWTAVSGLTRFHRLGKLFDYPQALIQPVDPDEPAGRLIGYTSEVQADGPLFARVRLTYTFEGDGEYTMNVVLRRDDPLVRIDEQYRNAGVLVVNLGPDYAPTHTQSRSFRLTEQGNALPIPYDKSTELMLFAGWDLFFKQVVPALALTGDSSGDLLGFLSTDPDWLPFPYNQAMHLASAPGPELTLHGNLWNGHRHWALYVGRETDFADAVVPGFYNWWNQRVRYPLDKVSTWQLEWPGMDEVTFPHTYFAPTDLPRLRDRLQAEPAVKALMESWEGRSAYLFRSACPEAAMYLYSGDDAELERLRARKPFDYVKTHVRLVHEACGIISPEADSNMTVTDNLLKRSVAMELVLGRGVMTPEARHEALVALAFLVYQMHDANWLPPNHAWDPAGAPYPVYVQGTPNQKACYYMTRAMTACMLTGHPKLGEWMAFALDEHERMAVSSVHESGALLESCFYSSRDTMRWGPFLTALRRAGCTDARIDKWLAIQKRAMVYLTDMLTPPEPRMGGVRVYNPLGRSSTGVVDPTLALAGYPWGAGDEAFRRRMRWAYEAQGRPALDIMASTGGRDVAHTLLGFALGAADPLEECPLRSVRYDGMGAIFRSRPGTDHESNAIFRHGMFSWDLYECNNGAVYLYGKGAPLLPRFGGYWNSRPNMMTTPLGNRLLFDTGDEDTAHFLNGLGTMDDCALLGPTVDYASGTTRDGHWQRSVLFAKDLDREDPVYLLVRDDVSRPDSGSALHWFIMSRQVQPNGVNQPGVVPSKGYSDDEWMAKLGHNWTNAPTLTGQFHHFEGQCGVDLDLFIAEPAEPKIITDAIACGPGLAHCVNPKLIECQQLVRIEQPAGKGYLTLFTPRWPDSAVAAYRTIAKGHGVAIDLDDRHDRLLLAHEAVTYKDDVVRFEGTAGMARTGNTAPLRLMVRGGAISAGGITLTCPDEAALTSDGKTVQVVCSGDPKAVAVTLPESMAGTKVEITAAAAK